MGGSSKTSNKPLLELERTDPEYLVEDYSNAVTANLVLNIGPEPVKTLLSKPHLMMQPKNGFQLPIDDKSDLKRSHKIFQKCSILRKNKKQQRVLCNEIRRLPNETIKQLALRIKTLVRKAFSLTTHDYKTQIDRNLDDDYNTTITKNSDKKEGFASIFNSRT